VQIPAGDGFEVIRQVGPEEMPMVVFVTAHDRYAVRAFEQRAFDYVLKPFDDARLRAALLRAAQLPAHDLARRLRALIADAATAPGLGGLAREMLVKLEPQPMAAPQRPPWLLHALEFVHARSAETVSLSALARCAGVHPVYLARAFRAHVGLSLGAYVRKLRVDHAADRLVSTDRSIAEIALEAGFSDQSHLTRVFRSTLGLTPAQYRDRFRRS
jgi:AraC family transcriptional regulator